MKPKVLIFLSSYNGEKYLREQIESLLNQINVDIFIKVCDDCSSDKTIQILKDYQKLYPYKFTYKINKTNKGYTYNFIDSIFENETDYDYYALCDQDDVWDKNKLINAITKIKNIISKNGCLYCSNLNVVNKDLIFIKKMHTSNVLHLKPLTFLARNMATGCTIVFNNNFYHHIKKYYPKNICFHDWWLFLLASYTADFYYDSNSYIKYRQHNCNAIGANDKNNSIKSKINNFVLFDKTKAKYNLIKELYEHYYLDIHNDLLKNIEYVYYYKTNIIYKIRLLFSKQFTPRTRKFRFKLKLLFNRY